MQRIDLYGYIEHKTGMSIDELIADSPERFRAIETEALRDLVVMNHIAGTEYAVVPGPDTLDNPECARLAREITIL